MFYLEKLRSLRRSEKISILVISSEPHFLCLILDKIVGTYMNQLKDDEENYSKGIKWYLDQMPRIRSDEIAIEKSPKYLIANRAPKRVKNLNKDIKGRFNLPPF